MRVIGRVCRFSWYRPRCYIIFTHFIAICFINYRHAYPNSRLYHMHKFYTQDRLDPQMTCIHEYVRLVGVVESTVSDVSKFRTYYGLRVW
jgi:hypothetical protein